MSVLNEITRLVSPSRRLSNVISVLVNEESLVDGS